MQRTTYDTRGGIRIHRETLVQPYSPADTALAERLDSQRGVLFSSSFEFPGRYTRWDMGFVHPAGRRQPHRRRNPPELDPFPGRTAQPPA